MSKKSTTFAPQTTTKINGNSGNVKDTLIDDKYVVLVDELAPHEKKNYKLKIKLDVVGHYHGIIKVSEVK